jgi:hypothetical protein
VKPISSKRLVLAIVVISVASTAAAYLGHYESWPLRTRQLVGYSASGLNCVIAVLGLWTRERAAWLAYLGVSLLAFLLLSVATPLDSLWMLMRAVFYWLWYG